MFVTICFRVRCLTSPKTAQMMGRLIAEVVTFAEVVMVSDGDVSVCAVSVAVAVVLQMSVLGVKVEVGVLTPVSS